MYTRIMWLLGWFFICLSVCLFVCLPVLFVGVFDLIIIYTKIAWMTENIHKCFFVVFVCVFFACLFVCLFVSWLQVKQTNIIQFCKPLLTNKVMQKEGHSCNKIRTPNTRDIFTVHCHNQMGKHKITLSHSWARVFWGMIFFERGCFIGT